MSAKSALRVDLDAEDRKTLAEDRKRMERQGSQLDDWLAFGPGLLIRRRLAKNIVGLAETDPAKGHRYSRGFKEQMEMLFRFVSWRRNAPQPAHVKTEPVDA